MNKRISGFTLIELMVTIAVIAIMAAIAFPNMRDFVATSRIANRAEQVGNLFRFAKGEAVRLGQPVIICGMQIRSDGRPSGNCDSAQYSSGMRAYADVNRNGVYDAANDIELRTINISANKSGASAVKVTPVTYSLNLKGEVTKNANTAPEFIFMPSGAFGSKPNKDNLAGLQLQSQYITFGMNDDVKYSEGRNFRGRIVTISPAGVVNICRDSVTHPSKTSATTTTEKNNNTMCVLSTTS